MEGNNQSMGVPSSGPSNMISSPGSGSYTAIHQRNPEVSPLPTTSVVHTPAPVRPDVTRSGVTPGPPQEGARAMTGLIVTSVSSSTPAYLSSAPLYPPDVSTALVPHSGGTNLSGFAGFGTVKKKRGRPRKYAPDGGIALSVTPLSSMPSSMSPSQKPSSMSSSQKRGRGRPRGSGKKQQLAALGSGGVGFTPHAITVAAGEDVATRIMSFSQQGPRGVCILSANGAISNVTLRQPAISGGTVTYEGRFEILSLSGSFLLTDSGGTRSRTGGLSVSLAGPDGRVLGGGVAGMLIAASPVQVVVGSFINLTKKVHKIVPKVENASNQSALDAAPNSGNAADVADDVKPTIPDDVKPTIPESSPQNHGMATSSDSGSPQGQIIPAQPFGWPVPHVLQEGRPNTDIDMSLPGG